MSTCDACPGGDCSSTTSTTITTTTSSTTTTTTIALFDLGHTADITSLQQSGSRLLSQDATGHWVLWNLATRSAVREADDGQATLAGTTLAVSGGGVLRVYDAVAGTLRFSMSANPTQFGLAQDGSYVWTADSAALGFWSSTDGHSIAARSGDYQAARLFAAAGEVRVALGPAGRQVIERIGTAGSRTVTSPFSGDFYAWFTDGQHFLTAVGTTVWAYDDSATQVGIWNLPTTANLTGQGAYLWTFASNQLAVYSLTGGATPVATYTEEIASHPFGVGAVIGVAAAGTGAVHLIDLSGPSPADSSHAVPVAFLSAFTADGPGSWAVGNGHGVVYDSDAVAGGLPPIALGYTFSVSGAPTGRAAAATAGGSILLFDLSSSLHSTGAISFASSHVEMSSDGTVLGASGNLIDDGYSPDHSLHLYTLPAGTLSRSFSYGSVGYPDLLGFSLSASGLRFGRITGTYDRDWTFERDIDDPSGSVLIDMVAGNGQPAFLDSPPIVLAPTGPGIGLPDQGRGAASTTRIYADATLVSAVPGYAVGWLTNDRLLVETYTHDARRGFDLFAGSSLYDAAGNFVAASPLPEIQTLQVVSDSRVYDRWRNVVYDTRDGSVVWSGPDLVRGAFAVTPGAVAGPYVVFPAAGHLVAARY